MSAMSSEPVIEGFGDEVVLVLGATLCYAMYICYQIYLCMLPERADLLLRGLADPATNTAIAAQPVAVPKSEFQRVEELIVEPEPEPEDTTEVPIRLKYLDDVTVTVECPLNTKVGVFLERFFSLELQEGKVVRLICYGKLLNEAQRTLRQFGINAENNVIHVQVSTPPVTRPETIYRELAAPPVSRFEANVASLAYLVLGGMLALFWYAHFQYRELFNTSATTALVGISGLFCVFVFAPAQPAYFPNLAERDF